MSTVSNPLNRLSLGGKILLPLIALITVVAVAGAILVNTRVPGDETEGQFRVRAGNNDTYSGSLWVSGPLGDSVSRKFMSADFRLPE